MRPFELALLLVNIPLLAWCLGRRTLSALARVLPALGVVFLLVHVVFEGVRWHMAPGYLVVVCLFGACCWQPVAEPGRWLSLSALALLIAAAVFGSVLPVFELPRPTGPYAIGTVVLHLVDSAREEARNGPSCEYRELMIQAWYPAEYSGPGQPYRPPGDTSFKKAHLALVRTHAAAGVPVAAALPRYPVVIFSPSWTGRRSQNTVQAEELASQGFIVVGIDHPFGTELTVFPDGRKIGTTLGEFEDCWTDKTFAEGIRAVEEELRIRVADVRFVLDELERLERSDSAGLFTDRIDTSRVGIFGHSFGGAVAAEVCLIDPRFKAGISLDGLIFGETMTKSIGKPFLAIGDGPGPGPSDLKKATGGARRELTFITENVRCKRRAMSQAGGYYGFIHGTRHMDFCDSPLYSPVKWLTHSGPIGHERAMEIINAYVVSFFQATLNGQDEPLLDASPSPYPEVEIERLHKK